jgi:hypothetical protein
MSPEAQVFVKVIAGTALVVALILGLIERCFRPSYLTLEESRQAPTWVPWFAWGLTALATGAYVLVDVLAWWG